MGILIIFAVASVPFAGLAVWRLYVRTGHQGLAGTVTGAMAAGSVLASLASMLSVLFGFPSSGLFLGPLALAVLGLLITAAAFWLAVKPWPAPQLSGRHR